MADGTGGQDGSRMQSRARLLGKKRSLFRRVFLDNLWLKVTSLCIAVALFYLVRDDKGKEADIEVPVVLSNLSESEVFTGELPRVLRVRVQDRWSRLIRALERKANPYLVDLRGFTDQSVFVFDRDKVRQLLGLSDLSIKSIYPSEFVVRLEAKIERTVPVRANLIGVVQDGYDILRDRLRVTPREIKIWGARSSVKEVSELVTHPIDVSVMEKDARVEVPIQKPSVPYLFLDDERVQVDVPVRARQGKVTIDDVEIDVKDCPEGLTCRVEPATANVTLVGALPTLFKVQKRTMPLEVFLDAGDFEATVPRHDAIRPACDRPSGVECTLSPRAVTLWITNPDADKKQPHRAK